MPHPAGTQIPFPIPYLASRLLLIWLFFLEIVLNSQSNIQIIGKWNFLEE